MARPLKKKLAVYDFTLKTMQAIYHEKNVLKVKRKDLPRFYTKKSLADFILTRSEFLSSEEYSITPEKWNGEKIVCRTTVNDAINMLIADNLIASGPEGFEYVPHMDEELKKHPVLEIAPKVEISVGVPESILFLTVNGRFANQIAEYLSAQFYMGDIIFIPLGRIIMCVGILPEEVLSGNKSRSKENLSFFRTRIETVLYMFKLKHPEFSYGLYYEMAYAAQHNPTMRGFFKAVARHTADQKTAENIIENRIESDVYGSVLSGLETIPDIADDVLDSEKRHRGSPDDDDDSDDNDDIAQEENEILSEEDVAAFFDSSLDDIINPELKNYE